MDIKIGFRKGYVTLRKIVVSLGLHPGQDFVEKTQKLCWFGFIKRS